VDEMKDDAFLYSFEKLDVWKEARGFVNGIYKITQKFPYHERFGLTSQIRRAATSIMANIAEGASRRSKKDFARFVQYSFGSLTELLSHFYVSHDLNYIDKNTLNAIRKKSLHISNQLNALHRSLE
jgi:four helix bundle protein